MKLSAKWFVLFLLTTIAAASLRIPSLAQRPMHTDEAVHADKFRLLLEENTYQYDPHEYHGPTLNYFTLILAPAWLEGSRDYTKITEVTLRIVPVLFGIGLVLLPLMLIKGLGPRVVLWTAVFTALSPAFVFYSRYYIQEILLVFFTFGAIASGWRYTQSKALKWALLTGLFLGLMHATKETCIIAFGAMAFAIVLTFSVKRKNKAEGENFKKGIRTSHIIIAAATTIIVSALFYSSFFTNPQGILDSYSSYLTYFQRASTNQLHIHPWYYYLDILTWVEFFERITWNEDIIVVLAVLGFIFAMTGTRDSKMDSSLVRFLAFYTLIMTVLYSAIPYKTPWSMLGFLHGMILLAGVGAVGLISSATLRWEKSLFWGALIIFGLISPGLQAYLQNYRYYADPSNPYVYAHTSKDIFNVVSRIEQVTDAHPNGCNMYIQVICPKDDCWPLPWYLRSFEGVGYWNEVDMSAPSAELIIAKPEVEPTLLKKLYNKPPPGQKKLYIPLFDDYTQLRPGVELRGYITKELSDRSRQQQSD
jgi:uncharacterized protein (TIGR03663 family)